MRTPNIDYEEILDVFLWGVSKLMQPTFHNLLVGYDEFAHRPQRLRLLKELRRQKLIEQTRRGKRAEFVITAVGRHRMRELDPQSLWGRRWDGVWRVVTFDVPETRRRERKLLWQSLRARKFGLLQRSVWVWPHPVETILKEIIHVEGVPECFCGFEAPRLVLCNDEEVIETAWDWEEIGHRQNAYLRLTFGTVANLDVARDLGALAAAARAERRAYEDAFIFDPLLPAALLPRNYRGQAVRLRHVRFRERLRQRFAEMASAAESDLK